MPAKTKTESYGFSAEERAAMKQRAAELRAEGKNGAKKADALQAALDSIAAMAPDDRALAERVHATVTSTAPELSPKTWYGMPAYANEDGKVVVFSRTPASSSPAMRRSGSRRPRTSTTVRCGRRRTRSRSGPRRSTRRSSRW